MIKRNADARRFSQIFKPIWLNASEYAPILKEVYDFVKKSGESPSIKTLHKIFEENDAQAYSLRYKAALDKLSEVEDDTDSSMMIHTIKQANNISIVRSFRELINNETMLLAEHDINGEKIIEAIQKWMGGLAPNNEDRTMDLKQAIEHLVQGAEFMPTNVRIGTGILPIDDWAGGGLRKKQLGIYVAPTGHGKSAILLAIGYRIAATLRKNVWFITNELPIEEYAERSLARININNKTLDQIIENPAIAYEGLDYMWKQDFHKRVKITEYNREHSVDDIIADMEKFKMVHGWIPDVIVIDYMERMKPSIQGYSRGDEWMWYGAIAKDLIRFAKKYNVLVWTACQTNRAGLTSDSLNMSMTQGSIRHLQEANLVVMGRQVDIPNCDDEIAIQMWQVKARSSKKQSRPRTVRCNLSRMSITNTEVEIEEKK